MWWPMRNIPTGWIAVILTFSAASWLPLLETGGEAPTSREETGQSSHVTEPPSLPDQSSHKGEESSAMGEEMTLVQQLKKRLQQVEERERSLMEESQRLEQLREDLQVLAEEQAKQAETLLAKQKAQAETPKVDPTQASLKHLVKVYEAMDPEEAALRIGKMKEGLALDILARVKEKKAASMLAGVEPQKAARLSEGLRFYRKAQPKPKD